MQLLAAIMPSSHQLPGKPFWEATLRLKNTETVRMNTSLDMSFRLALLCLYSHVMIATRQSPFPCVTCHPLLICFFLIGCFQCVAFATYPRLSNTGYSLPFFQPPEALLTFLCFKHSSIQEVLGSRQVDKPKVNSPILLFPFEALVPFARAGQQVITVGKVCREHIEV